MSKTNGQRVYPGTVAQANSKGFRRMPWHRSLTTDDDAEGRHRIRAQRGNAMAAPSVPRSTDARTKADDLAKRFVEHLDGMKVLLGRPVTPADLSEEFCTAFGLDLWKAMGHRLDEPVPGIEFFRKIAAMYLQGPQKDERWTPSGQGFSRRKAEQWKP